MEQSPPSSIRFGSFSLEPKTGELLKNGSSVRLPPQPSKVLVLLATRAGQIVTREEIRDQIWKQDIFVDFDKGLNFCIKQIRTALHDNADRPTYIETFPRRGYRFIAPVEFIQCGDRQVATESPKDQDHVIETPLTGKHRTVWSENRLIWVSLVVMASIFGLGYSSVYKSRTVQIPNRGWVLIAAFENRTGEPIIDGAVEAALERELSESQFISVLPPERIQDTLWLMRKGKGTILEPDVAREVAMRDGKTTFVLTGRVEKLGHTYLLSTSLVEPDSGVLKRSLSEEAAGQDEILPAVHRLARGVRDIAGESGPEIRRGSKGLEKATTISLKALQLYSKGIAFINQDEWILGKEMLNRAVQEDPEFASAHVYLAWCYTNGGKGKEAEAHFQRAFELAETTTDRERYFILGSYYGFKNEREKAIQAYEVLVHLYPDDFWGVNNLAFELTDAGRNDEALPYIVQRAELRPNDPGANYAAWDALSKSGRDLHRAQFFLERINTLANEAEARKPLDLQWIRFQFVTVDKYMRDGDYARTLQELDRVATKLGSALADARVSFLDELGNRYANLGRLHDAERYFRQLPETMQHFELSWLAEERGDTQALRKELLAQFAAGDQLGPGTASRLAREGFFLQAEKVLEGPLMKQIEPRSRVEGARGELAFARGRRREGLREMGAAWQSLRALRNDQAMMNASFLADALHESGNPLEAIQVLEQQLVDKPDLTALAGITACEARLVRLYRSVGRESDAQAMQVKMREQLSVADADHPLLASMRTAQNVAALH